MVMKEFREIRGIVFLAVIGFGFAILADVKPGFPNPFRMVGGHGAADIPFVDGSSCELIVLVAGAMAIALGLRQTLGESARGTYLLLLHRPASRRGVIGMKVFVGLAAYVICGAAAILIFGLWAATPGTHASPFEWSMTIDAWCALVPPAILYLGAFLSGLRPGRWFGTRLLPLVAAFCVVAIWEAMTEGTNVGWGGVVFMLLLVVGLVDAIFFVAQTREYS
jgi:hypothetical protein